MIKKLFKTGVTAAAGWVGNAIGGSTGRTIATKAVGSLFSKDGGFIKKGYSKELDAVTSFRDESRQHIIEMESQERKKTGLNTLKIKYNNVLGHFFEITQLQKKKFMETLHK